MVNSASLALAGNVRSWNPAAFAARIANQQPRVSSVFDHNFVSRLNCEFSG
jgi:hypothetical protein